LWLKKTESFKYIFLLFLLVCPLSVCICLAFNPHRAHITGGVYEAPTTPVGEPWPTKWAFR